MKYSTPHFRSQGTWGGGGEVHAVLSTSSKTVVFNRCAEVHQCVASTKRLRTTGTNMSGLHAQYDQQPRVTTGRTSQRRMLSDAKYR